MGQDPEALRQDIEQTRRALTDDVDALTEKVTPSKVVGRQVDRTREAVTTIKQRAQGNPLAAGLVAELADTVKDHAKPLTEHAKQAAQSAVQELRESAQQAVQSVKETAAEAAGTVKQDVSEQAGQV